MLLAWLHDSGSPPFWPWGGLGMAATALGAWFLMRRRQAGLEQRMERTLAEHGEELARVNTQLLVAMEQGQQAAKAKSAFLASMSHELRTPLNAILLYTELLQEDPALLDAPAALQDLGRIRSSGRNLLHMIDEVLDISRIEAGRITLHPDAIELHLFLADLASHHQLAQGASGARLEVEVDPLLGSLVADRMRLRQVLDNLLAFALKASHDGPITLRADLQAGLVRFEVGHPASDVPREELGRLLEAFPPIEESPARRKPHQGFGLAIAKGLVGVMGGMLEVECEGGLGTRFHFALPTAPLKEGPKRRKVARTLPRKPKALVVDDDPLMRDALTRALTKEGFWVGTAANGPEALDLVRTLRPDLITLDLRMEGMDGYQVLQILKEDPQLQDIPVILVSALDERAKGFALGAAEVLRKPVPPEALAEVLDRFRTGDPPFQVLVVEDDEATREALTRAIAQAGWVAVPAPDAETALIHLEGHRPHLLLLDLLLPGMDGFALVERMQQRQAWKDIPVIVLTGKETTPEDQARLAKPNVHRVLRKSGQGRRELVDLVLQVAQREMEG